MALGFRSLGSRVRKRLHSWGFVKALLQVFHNGLLTKVLLGFIRMKVLFYEFLWHSERLRLSFLNPKHQDRIVLPGRSFDDCKAF